MVSFDGWKERGLFIRLFVFFFIYVSINLPTWLEWYSAVSRIAELSRSLCMTLKERPPLTSFSFLRLSEQVVSCVVLQSLSTHFLLFHSSVLEPDFHLSGSAQNRIETWFIFYICCFCWDRVYPKHLETQQIAICNDSVSVDHVFFNISDRILYNILWECNCMKIITHIF